jgi:hypothetical protein
MRSAKKIAIALACLGAWLLPASQASAATPAFKLDGIHLPTNFVPGSEGRLFLLAANVGGAPTSSPLTLTDTLPVGLDPVNTEEVTTDPNAPDPECVIADQTVTCTADGPIAPGHQLEVRIIIDVDPLLSEGELEDEATLTGGGALDVSVDTTTTVSGTPATFSFLPQREGGPNSQFSDPDGISVSAAGSRPYQLTTSLGFPTEEPEKVLVSAGHPRDITIDFPRGLVLNPTATPVLCTEAELVTMVSPGCPTASAIGTVTVVTFEAASAKAATSPLYNMVPPPGQPAAVAFDAASVGVFVHLSGEVRSDGDFGISSFSRDTLALTFHPVFGARADLWGKPSDPAHDDARGICAFGINTEKETGKPLPCPVPETKTALLTTPGDCPAKAIETRFAANSWEQPSAFIEGGYENPSLLSGCNELDFEPKIEAKPSTTLTDSPSGLDFNLHQPQQTDFETRATSVAKDVALTLPEGLVVNPSAAQGQQACSSAQIGLLTGVGQTPINFSKAPASCPDAAKLGTVEVRTPLLAEVDESKTKILRDPEGQPIPRTLQGAVYLAKPFDNPFGTLLALYLDVEDPLSGTVAKFAARVSADPVTGRLTNTLIEAPQLPIEDVRVTTFQGSRAALRTPAACATYTASARLVPWSAPEGPTLTESDSFALGAAPGGGACPASPETAPNNPGFVAGTVDPQAGAFSPFVLRVSREDGSQPISGFEATLPAGLTAKLAGVPYCSEAQIAQAQSRNRPEEGAVEQASPSCPAASEVGSVDVAAGAGPTPLHTSGRVYLAGPYKGAPLSFVIITPAIAGPFDLGTVVVRTAAYLNPETAVVRAVSDPLPTILEGIPLDLRQAVVKMDRPDFTLNPTSCEPKSILATTTSVFAQPATMTRHFQAGGCGSLGFKPKIDIRLKGSTKRTGHPALRAVATFRAGDANTERAAVTLPPSAFLDQAHIGTVCTRVQFAAKQCPKRSIYGFAKATTPLLDKGLEGPVYLRSSNHELPDLVVALAGQVEVVLAGRVDSINGGIRNTFEAAPDAPVTRFVLEMQGGKKGLLQNSENLCGKKSYATVKLRAHNGRIHNFKALVKNDCKKKKKKKGGKGKGR